MDDRTPQQRKKKLEWPSFQSALYETSIDRLPIVCRLSVGAALRSRVRASRRAQRESKLGGNKKNENKNSNRQRETKAAHTRTQPRHLP